MDYSVITNNTAFFLKGLAMSGELTAWTLIGGLILGTPLAVARWMRSPFLKYPAMAIIEVVRGIPILMLIFWGYFLLPHVLGTNVPAYVAGLSALILFNTAYSAEIIRAGILSVDKGNIEAGRASGLNFRQILRYIIFPQAFASMLPALMSQAVMVYKTTSLVFVIGIIDFFRAATIVNNREFKPFEIFLFVAVVYFIPCTIVSRLSRTLESRRMDRLGIIRST